MERRSKFPGGNPTRTFPGTVRIRRSNAPAQPAEMAGIYVFLASSEASYITGEIYGITGGLSGKIAPIIR